jgi:alkylhydroperoxidase/carboxymuconolactone decarboxylase family protein YurZ
VAEHVAGLTATAAALQLHPDAAGGPGAALVALLDGEDAGDAAPTLREIAAWAREHLGLDRAPAIWRALAHRPKLLEVTWRKDRLVMGPGVLDALTRDCAALAVAQFRQSAYWIAYHTTMLRRSAGLDDGALVELAGAVMHIVSFNTIAHAMRLDAPFDHLAAADVAPGGRYEHLVPGPRPGLSHRGDTAR